MTDMAEGVADDLPSSLASVISTLTAMDVSSVDGADLATAVLEVERVLNAANALSAVLLERFERDGGWAVDGALSAAAWTAQRSGSARAGLRSRRRQGAALALLPAVATAARHGRLSTEHLRAIGDCAHRHPDLAAEHDALWLEEAEALPAEGFRLVARHWLAAAADTAGDQQGNQPGDEVSTLHTSRTFEGWLRVDGLFVPSDADLVEAALGAGIDRALRAAHDGDPSVTGRPVSGLRADALLDLLTQTMRQEPSDTSAPDRYRVAVVVHHGKQRVPPKRAVTPAPTGSC